MLGSNRIFGIVAKKDRLLFPTRIVTTEPEISISVKPEQFANEYCFILPTCRMSLTSAILIDSLCKLKVYYDIRRRSKQLLELLIEDKKLRTRKSELVKKSFHEELNRIIDTFERRFHNINPFEELIYRGFCFSRLEFSFKRDEETQEYVLQESVKCYIPDNDWFVLNIDYDDLIYPVVQAIVDNVQTLDEAVPLFRKRNLFKDHVVISANDMNIENDIKIRRNQQNKVYLTNDLFEFVLKGNK